MPQDRPDATLIITATENLRRDVERMCLRDGAPILFGPRVMSLRQFVRLVADPDAVIARRGLRRLAIREALARTSLKHFGAVRTLPGTIGCVDDAIQALKRSGIGPAELRTLFATRGGAAEFDLLHTYEAYTDLLAEWAAVDEGDLIAAALTRLRTPDAWPAALRGIRRFDCVGFAPDDPLLTRLRNTLDGTSREMGTVPENGDCPHFPDLDIVALPSPLQEIRWAARYCRQLVDEGVAPDAIAIVCPPSPRFAQLLARALANKGVASEPPRGDDGALLHDLARAVAGTADAGERPLGAWFRTIHDWMGDAESAAWRDTFRTMGGDSALAVTLHQWGRLEEVVQQLTQMAACAPAVGCTGAEFQAIVTDTIGWPASPPTGDGPRCFTFGELPAHPVREVICLHALEGILPPAPTPLPFCGGPEFRDAECAALRTVLPFPDEVLSQGERQWERWRALAANAFTAAWPLAGADGREAIPSTFLPPVETHLLMNFAPGEDVVRHASCVMRNDQAPSGVFTHDAPRTTHDVVSIIDPAIRAHIGARFRAHRFSVSQLETYARSPFAFFCERVLGLEPEEAITPDVAPKDRGTIIHAILDRFCRAHMAAFREAVTVPPAAATIRAAVEAIAGEVVAAYRDRFPWAHPVLVERLCADAATLCTQLIETELARPATLPAPLLPVATEWVFGHQERPPLTIPVETEGQTVRCEDPASPGRAAHGFGGTGAEPPLDDVPIELAGTIDRIDCDDDQRHFAIYDYKTGSPDFPRSGIVAGKHLQLPVYLRAVRELFLPSAEPVAALLIVTNAAGKRQGLARKETNAAHVGLSAGSKSLVSETEWSHLLRTAEAHLQRLVGMIRRAEFPTDPHDCKWWCAWRRVCGKSA